MVVDVIVLLANEVSITLIVYDGNCIGIAFVKFMIFYLYFELNQ